MLTVALNVDKNLVKAKRTEHAFDHSNEPAVCELSMLADYLSDNKRDRDTSSFETVASIVQAPTQ